MPAKQSPGSSEHGVQEGELIMSVLLILTLLRSVNILSQERGDGFPEPSTQPCVSLLLGRSLWLQPRGRVWTAGHLLGKAGGSVLERMETVPGPGDIGRQKGAGWFWGARGSASAWVRTAAGFCQ